MSEATQLVTSRGVTDSKYCTLNHCSILFLSQVFSARSRGRMHNGVVYALVFIFIERAVRAIAFEQLVRLTEAQSSVRNKIVVVPKIEYTIFLVQCLCKGG